MASRYASAAALLVVVFQATSAAYLVPEGKSSTTHPRRALRDNLSGIRIKNNIMNLPSKRQEKLVLWDINRLFRVCFYLPVHISDKLKIVCWAYCIFEKNLIGVVGNIVTRVGYILS